MFITFEGVEGAGKGTVLEGVREWLTASGRRVLTTREPGGSDLGKALRALLLDARSRVVPEAELFLYLADRAQHVREVISPALEEGVTVISDRYADSTIVYQGFGRGLDIEELYRLNRMAVGDVWPDLTVLLDLPPETGLHRARRRNASLGLEESEGRFEAEHLDFHRRVRQGYLAWAACHPGRFCLINADADPGTVLDAVLGVLSSRLA